MIDLQPVYNHILVSVDTEWKSEIHGKNGIIGIRWETDIDRSVGAVTSGTVVNVPRGMTQGSYLSKVRQRVNIGDTVHFHFNSIAEDSKVQLHPDDKPYYLVHMESIFCIIRDGEMLMYGDRVLCEPLFDDDVEVLDDGMRVKKSKSGIITEINVSHNIKKAKLAYIGEAPEGQVTTDVSPGDFVFYEKDADFENEIQGKTYFCMIQDDLLMKSNK